jgi:Tol biopolymer transport system component
VRLRRKRSETHGSHSGRERSRPLLRFSLIAFALCSALLAWWVSGRGNRVAEGRRPVVASRAAMFVVPLHGGTPRRLSSAVGSFAFLSSPQFAPRGRSLAFTAQRCLTCAHLLMLLRNNSLRVLSRSALRAAWFPDGKRLLFVHIGRDGTTLYRIRADGRGLQEIAGELDSDEGASFDTPAVAPAGTPIAYSIEVEPIESRELFVRHLTEDEPRMISRLPLSSIEPDFSSDGHLVVFACELRNSVFGICTTHPDGKGKRVFTRGPEDHHPVFSPDGSTIVFSSNRGNARFGIRSLYVVSTRTHRLRRLTRGADDSEPAFSADGKRVVFVRRSLRYVRTMSPSTALGG